jgi:hypothetical protein
VHLKWISKSLQNPRNKTQGCKKKPRAYPRFFILKPSIFLYFYFMGSVSGLRTLRNIFL